MSETFFFRGTRNYVLAADLFDHIINSASPAVLASRLDFKTFKKTNCDVEVFEQSTVPESAEIIASYKEDQRTLVMVEKDWSLSKAIPCDEDELERNFVFSAQDYEVSVPFPIKNASFIRSAVVAFKLLLKKRSEQKSISFQFVRIQMDVIPSSEFTIKYSRVVAKKFYEGLIEVQGKKVGKLYLAEGS